MNRKSEKNIAKLEAICADYSHYLEKKIATISAKNNTPFITPAAVTLTKKRKKIERLRGLLNDAANASAVSRNGNIQESNLDNENSIDPRLAEFKSAFDKLKPQLTTKKDHAFIKAIGHVFLSIATIGMYPAIRASYAYSNHGSSKFWLARKEMFSEQIEDKLNKSNKPSPLKGK